MVDNRIRERLTGAAILVAVIVLLVPELLSRPQQAGREQAAAVDEAPIRSYRLSLGDSQQSTTPITPVASATSVTPATTVSSATSASAAAGASDGARTEPAPGAAVARLAEAAPAPQSTAPVPARQAVPAPAERHERAVSAHASGSAKAARAESAPQAQKGQAGKGQAEKAEKVAHSEHAAGAWAVQVGSFGSRENADHLVRSLKLKGYGAFITETSSGGRKWYRVRVGPQRTRGAADSTAARLRAAGLRGAVAQAR